VNHIGERYSQNVGLRLKLSPHPMPLFLERPHLGALYATRKEREKNLVNKIQGWESIHQKYKANENTSKHNPNKKQKQTINKKKSGKNLVQRRVTIKK
jgi:hypothetical protein